MKLNIWNQSQLKTGSSSNRVNNPFRQSFMRIKTKGKNSIKEKNQTLYLEHFKRFVTCANAKLDKVPGFRVDDCKSSICTTSVKLHFSQPSRIRWSCKMWSYFYLCIMWQVCSMEKVFNLRYRQLSGVLVETLRCCWVTLAQAARYSILSGFVL